MNNLAMAEKNYAPPDAPVADLDTGPPPRTVINATILLWISFAARLLLGLLVSQQHAASGVDSGTHRAAMAIFFVFMALVAGLYVAIFRGHNWARSLHVPIELFRGYGFLRSATPFGTTALETACHSVGWLCCLAAFYLIFVPASTRAWFARRS